MVCQSYLFIIKNIKRICLTHEEGSSLSNNAALALMRICLTQEVEWKPRARDKDNVEAGRVATVGEGANFGEKDKGDLAGEEASTAPRFRR